MPLPTTAKALFLDDALLATIQDALSPPREARLEDALEIELEVKGEGTFTLTLDDGELTGAKGMADDPFVSVEVPAGGLAFAVEFLDEAIAGWPKAPALAARQRVLRGLPKDAQTTALKGLAKLDGAAVELDLAGVGVVRLARGALDEATRKLKVSLPGDTLRKVAAGAPLETLKSVKISGDTRLPGDLLAALGPVWVKLQQARAS